MENWEQSTRKENAYKPHEGRSRDTVNDRNYFLCLALRRQAQQPQLQGLMEVKFRFNVIDTSFLLSSDTSAPIPGP